MTPTTIGTLLDLERFPLRALHLDRDSGCSYFVVSNPHSLYNSS